MRRKVEVLLSCWVAIGVLCFPTSPGVRVRLLSSEHCACVAGLMWSLAAEHKCPGLFYVGASRAADVAAMALENPLSVKDAQTIGPLLVALAVFAGLHMILCTCFLTQFNAQAMVMLRGLPARRWPLLHSKLRSSN